MTYLGERVLAQKVRTLLVVLEEKQFQLDAEQLAGSKLDGDMSTTSQLQTFGQARESFQAEHAALLEKHADLLPLIGQLKEEEDRDAADDAFRHAAMTRDQRLAERFSPTTEHPANRAARRKRSKR